MAIISSVLFSFKFSKKSTSALTESAHSSLMFSPPTVTASDSFFSRRPPQVGQGTSFINASIILALLEIGLRVVAALDRLQHALEARLGIVVLFLVLHISVQQHTERLVGKILDRRGA